ncbi:protein RTF1 homolog [Pyrus communis]|uniref:protein RTF1 homolog n=1 Tax=Pyrus communis TaxID=23211 RepID=UPI0035BEC170
MSDLELESDLLEAAGRTSSAGKKRDRLPPSRKQRGGSYSDDGSDSRGEDSDDDRGSRKPSQVPLKKRFEPTERGSDEECDSSYDGSDHEGENSDESDFGPDLYKNDADRKRLAAMSELEREMILTNRAEKKGGKDFMEKLRSKRGNAKSTPSRKEDPLPFSRGARSSARAADKSAAMDDALNKLRAKRMKQQDSKDHHKLRDTSKGGAGSQDISPTKHRSIQTETLDGLPNEEEALNADDEFLDSDEESSELLTFEDIKDITIPRSKLAKWVMEPFFEELIVGCFVRVGFGISSEGPVYRLCMVQNVVATNPGREYKLEGKVTHKYLNCVWGSESSASKWPMANVSDSPPQEKEFEQWLKEVKRAGQMPSKQEVVEKKDTLLKSNKFVYSAATVKQMLQDKKASARPVNVAIEKERLRRQLDAAESKGNDEEVERIKTRLQELEASRQTQGTDSKAFRLAEMNRKNRFENFINASGLKPRNMNLKAGEAGYDPFSRRWTRSRNYYDARPGGGDEAAEATDGTTGTGSNGEKANVTGELGMQATEAALEAAAGAGKLVDTSAPVDKGTESYMLHNFELPISLAPLQKYGGPQGAGIAYMERRQRIEATVGRRVLDDGRRHASALTIKDYMRRQEMHHAHPDPDS